MCYAACPLTHRSEYARSEAGNGSTLGCSNDEPGPECHLLPDLPKTWVPKLVIARDMIDMRCPRVSLCVRVVILSGTHVAAGFAAVPFPRSWVLPGLGTQSHTKYERAPTALSETAETVQTTQRPTATQPC